MSQPRLESVEPLPRNVYARQVGWRGGHLEWREGGWKPVRWRQRRSRGEAASPRRRERLPGSEWAPRCDCGRRAVWRGTWRCEACGRARLSGYRWVGVPRELPGGAADGAPVFRSPEETNCDRPIKWLDDVEWLTSWGRSARAARMRLRGAVPGVGGEAQVRGWHRDRMRGLGERFERVSQCGADTAFEWVERADEHGEVLPHGKGRRFPHRTACGQWRLCKRCVRRRRERLRDGVLAQRKLAMSDAHHRSKLGRYYAGPEGRWCERLITFTVRHQDLGSDVAVLPRAWRKVEAPLRRHLKMRGCEERPVFVRSIEVAGTDHAHLHVWQLGPFLDYTLLRAWWGAALESEGYSVDRRSYADAVAGAFDKRVAEWLLPYVDADGTVPWPVMDVRGSEGGKAALYVTKVAATAALYTQKQGVYVDLEPVHAARVYEALEGVRVTQWARGWAPPRGRSWRWMLRRVSQVATRVTGEGGGVGGEAHRGALNARIAAEPSHLLPSCRLRGGTGPLTPWEGWQMAKTKKRSGGFGIVRAPSAPMVVVQKSAPRRRRAAAVVRRVAGAARRGASAAAGAARQRDAEVSAVLGALALGIAEGTNDAGQQRLTLPTVGGIDPALLYGGAAALLPHALPRLGKGKMVRRLAAAGVGIFCVGVARSATRGGVKVSGDPDYGDED